MPLLRSSDPDTVTAAVAALRNLSIMKGNEVSTFKRYSSSLSLLPILFIKIHIVDSGALVELSRLLSLQEHSEIQCHAAGTIRNLAAEEQHVVSCNPTPRARKISIIIIIFLKPIIEAGCLKSLAERLKDSKHVPGDVLSEISAAVAVLAANSEWEG